IGAVLGLPGGIIDDVLHAAGLARVYLMELVHDRFFGGNEGGNFQARDPADVVDGQDVERIGHGQEQLVVEARNRNHFVAVTDVAGDQVGQFLPDAATGEVDRGN